jgi:hypothetical protein
MNLSVAVLGVDIAKLKFDVCLIKENGKAKHKVLTNTTHGFEQLVVWLNSHQAGSLHVCLEATGNYGEALALHLFDAGYRVSVARSGSRQSLCREPPDQNQNRQSGCRTDCPFLSVATTASVAAACAAGA